MEDRAAVRASFQLAVVFLTGLLIGAWVFIAPWVIGFPAGRPGEWTSSTWSNVWIGAVVVGASATGLVAALGLGLAAAQRSSRTGQRAEASMNAGTGRGV